MAIVTGSTHLVRTTLTAPLGWQEAMKAAIRDPAELCRAVGLGSPWSTRAAEAARQFPVFAPAEYVRRMRWADPDDPLLRQVLPLDAELQPATGFVADPVGDQSAEIRPGLLKKYHGRALLITTGACAVHCRYCFRRHFPYGTAPRSVQEWEPALAALAEDPTVHEVILSGGDPLTLTDPSLRRLVEQLWKIDHLRRLRIHTRLPIVIPQRITPALLAWFASGRLSAVMVVHANHAAELDDHVGQALGCLREAGVVLLNQSVLLRGVNDSLEALTGLSLRLLDLGVLPYYLHQLDRVSGAAHFEVPLAKGLELVEQLRSRLPGYAVPRYVRETAGAHSKQILA